MRRARTDAPKWDRSWSSHGRPKRPALHQPAQLLDRAAERAAAATYVAPEIADGVDATARVAQRDGARAHLAALELFPRARRRHRRARPRAHGVGGGERRAVAVAARVDENAPGAVGLVELLRQLRGMPLHELRADRMREARHLP